MELYISTHTSGPLTDQPVDPGDAIVATIEYVRKVGF